MNLSSSVDGFLLTIQLITHTVTYCRMKPLRELSNWLDRNTTEDVMLFASTGLRQLFPALSDSAFNNLLSRAENSGHLKRLCRGLYLSLKRNYPVDGDTLYRTIPLLRSNAFSYISLETALSDAGVISQMPINYISIMTSGRSNTIHCSGLGKIEFVHTKQKPEDIIGHLTYDQTHKLWRANVFLAIRDMKATRRNCDLINWDIANEFIR